MHLITPMILYFLAQDLIPGHWPVSLAPVHTRSDRRVVHTALAQARAVQLGQPGERAGRRPARRSQAESVVQGERGHRARAQPDEAGEEKAGDCHAPEAAQPAGHANEKGQLIATDPHTVRNMTGEVEEEKGHVCRICREGYKYHPQKVLAIYTYSKKAELEPLFEAKSRKSVGHSTVTHVNLVHIDYHTNAIRSSRTCREEWENATLQNANTKCNGILPIWGPHVSETLFSNALARHNSYLLEATGIRDSYYMLCVHDLKLLLWRFADNASFSEESGGGGRESNINLIPYMIHIILYSINT